MTATSLVHSLRLLFFSMFLAGRSSSAFLYYKSTAYRRAAAISPQLFVSLSTTSSGASVKPNDGTSVPWDSSKVVNEAFSEDKRPIILFDGVCNLCNGGVNFALDHDKQGKFRFASLQSKVGQSLLVHMGRPRYDLSSIILVKSPTEYYRESDAILRISQGLDELPFRLLGFAGLGVPRLLRDQVYHVVANNRYRFGETDQCRLDLDGEYDGRFVADPFVEEKKE